jgi:hypothetical protein
MVSKVMMNATCKPLDAVVNWRAGHMRTPDLFNLGMFTKPPCAKACDGATFGLAY